MTLVSEREGVFSEDKGSSKKDTLWAVYSRIRRHS